ncbi:MAG: CocE/NonD family hydrolase, partial [Venatoribacter sp.]
AFQHFDNVASKFQVPMLMGALGGDEDTTFDGTSTEAFWAIRSPLEHIHKIRVPTFIVGGLHDLFQRSEPLAYETMKLNTTTKLLMGPWNHLEAAVGKGLPSKEGIPRLNQIALQWFDQYVKGEDVAADKLPNVTQYVKGADKYITSTDWPLPEAKAVTLYMHNRGELKETAPSKGAANKQYLNTPLGGLCSMSASQWTFGALGMIPLPCYTENNLADLSSLVYETPVLEEGMYINGPIIANVWISSNAKDAQVSVRVSDVHPNGKAMALTNGIHTASLRAVDESRSRYLDGVMIQPWHPYTKEAKQPLEKGAPTLVPVEIFPTSAWIAPGHKLRVSVGSGNLGQGLPPLPTLLEMYDWTLHTKLYNEADFPSHVVLPVVPEQVLQ